MASKPHNFPLIQFKGFNKLSELLNVFPFDIVIKHMLVNGIKCSEHTLTIAFIIDRIRNMYDGGISLAQSREAYTYREWKNIRLTTVNGQLELSYELIDS